MDSPPHEDQVPTRLGDETAALTAEEKYATIKLDSSQSLAGIGAGDTTLDVGFLAPEEADAAFAALQVGGEIPYQQWYHMVPRKSKSAPLLPLSRIKCALAVPDASDGWMPHYRFPVNDQNRYPVLPVSSSPTLEGILTKLRAKTGIAYNHAVVLLYRDGEDAIGFHKDKTVDLDPSAPIASISLGAARPYVLKEREIFNPKSVVEFSLPHGCLLQLGPQTNAGWYHSIRKLSPEEEQAAAIMVEGGLK